MPEAVLWGFIHSWRPRACPAQGTGGEPGSGASGEQPHQFTPSLLSLGHTIHTGCHPRGCTCCLSPAPGIPGHTGHSPTRHPDTAGTSWSYKCPPKICEKEAGRVLTHTHVCTRTSTRTQLGQTQVPMLSLEPGSRCRVGTAGPQAPGEGQEGMVGHWPQSRGRGHGED